jgi:hypothetical protein
LPREAPARGTVSATASVLTTYDGRQTALRYWVEILETDNPPGAIEHWNRHCDIRYAYQNGTFQSNWFYPANYWDQVAGK